MKISSTALPHGLLDLKFTREYGLSALRRATASTIALRSARRMHQAALATPPPEPPVQMDNFNMATVGRRRRGNGSLADRTGLEGGLELGHELEKRVRALEAAAIEEETSLTPPFYTEEDLMFLYEGLLAIPAKPPQPPVDPAILGQQLEEQDAETIREAEGRLLQTYPDLSWQTVDGDRHHVALDKMPTYRKVVMHAQAVVSRLEEMRDLAMRGSDAEGRPVAGPSRISVPISVLSLTECESLIRACTRTQDGPGALFTLEIMKRSGMPIPEVAVTDTLEMLAKAGNVNATDSVIANFINSPTERQRHLHVKAHLRATPPNTIPSSALSVLHAYEQKALFAPMQTYTRCIYTLFFSSSSVCRAQGWDLFSHMRYVAHPNPDAFLYTTMIRACAFPLSLSRGSEPEKALDIWTEMTIDKKIEPTVEAYNAIILACARSGEKVFVNEAYRLAKQMMDAYRDARGFSAFGPDRHTFIALLEGAKRIGDLGRARWILAEMVRDAGSGMQTVDGNTQVFVDEEIMMHIFQAYSTYRPPFKREATLIVPEEQAEKMKALSDYPDTPIVSSNEAPETSPGTGGGSTLLTLDSMPSFSHIPPQSHEEVLSEATFLFQRILHDTGVLPIPPEHQQHHQEGRHYSPKLVDKFARVKITSRLVASYISIFFRHAPLEHAERMLWRLFEQLKVPQTARVYVEALEACAYATKGSEREAAVKFAEDLWPKWKELEDAGEDAKGKISARIIERAYAARLRLYAVTDEVSSALRLVYSFVQRYPPASVRTPTEKPWIRSTRTSLVGGSRPLVRMTTTVEVPDDAVPPLLTFRDLEVLHHRLVAFEMHKEVGYLKWVAKSYEWMLRVRRDEAFRAKPVKPEDSPDEEV